MLRPPAVAGRFYSGQPDTLTQEVERYLESGGIKQPAMGCVAPHAGFMYSGHVAGAVYSRLDVPPVAIILGPNHRGLGSPLAIFSSGDWETPLGRVPIEASLATTLKKACAALEDDPDAHRLEHSLEVQLPFLQVQRPDVRIVPIALSVGRYETLEQLGRAIGQVIFRLSPRPLVVASSDMNHYEAETIGRVKDRKAIDAMLTLEPRKLYDTVRQEQVSMCGYEAATVLLCAAGALGAQKMELVRYATSGDITGDRSSVVGYAGLLVC